MVQLVYLCYGEPASKLSSKDVVSKKPPSNVVSNRIVSGAPPS
jgi:hypothetical protein